MTEESENRPLKAVVIMGVAGSGKSTVGRELAQRLGWDYYDGDDFHPIENVEKMSRGVPLSDQDRRPWLAALHDLLIESAAEDRPVIISCSALKRSYRNQLRQGIEQLVFVYLRGDRQLLNRRLSARSDHFMRPEMLDNQLAELEEPDQAITVPINADIDSIIEKILKALVER